MLGAFSGSNLIVLSFDPESAIPLNRIKEVRRFIELGHQTSPWSAMMLTGTRTNQYGVSLKGVWLESTGRVGLSCHIWAGAGALVFAKSPPQARNERSVFAKSVGKRFR